MPAVAELLPMQSNLMGINEIRRLVFPCLNTCSNIQYIDTEEGSGGYCISFFLQDYLWGTNVLNYSTTTLQGVGGWGILFYLTLNSHLL